MGKKLYRFLHVVLTVIIRLRPIRAIYLWRKNRKPVLYIPMTPEEAALFISGQNGRLRQVMGSLYKKVKW